MVFDLKEGKSSACVLGCVCVWIMTVLLYGYLFACLCALHVCVQEKEGSLWIHIFNYVYNTITIVAIFSERLFLAITVFVDHQPP